MEPAVDCALVGSVRIGQRRTDRLISGGVPAARPVAVCDTNPSREKLSAARHIAESMIGVGIMRDAVRTVVTTTCTADSDDAEMAIERVRGSHFIIGDLVSRPLADVDRMIPHARRRMC